METIVSRIEEEKEIYEKALEEAVVYYTVGEYDAVYGEDWSNEKMHEMDKQMSIYCLSNGFKIKEYPGTSLLRPRKRYPLTAWKYFYAENI